MGAPEAISDFRHPAYLSAHIIIAVWLSEGAPLQNHEVRRKTGWPGP